MNAKKLLLGSLIAGGSLTVVRLLLTGAAAKEPACSKPSTDAMDVYIKDQMRRLNIPGAALAIVEGDGMARIRCYGRARPGGEAPTPQTLFFIGSLTKSFTALAVMQLVEAGKVALDAPVRRYLPWFRLAGPQSPDAITVRHLLNQTSGLPMAAGMKTLANTGNRPNAVEHLARLISTLEPSHPAGAVCEYCNLNYDLLGRIVDAASGEAYADYIQNHIFRPLGMRHSYTSKEAVRKNGLAMGHRYWFGMPVPAPDLPVPQESIASGQLISCAEDMARYLMVHMNGGRCGDAQILSEAGIEALHQGAAEYIMFGISSGRYAMGWFVDETGSTKILSHGGNVPDFSAYMGLLSEQKKGIVLLINSDHYGMPPILAEIGWGATALLAGKQPGPTRLGFIPWMMRALAMIPLLQIIGVIAILRSVGAWKRNPGLCSSQGRLWRRHLLLPLIPNLTLATIPIYLYSSKMLGYLRLFMPDVYWTALISGGFAGVWAFLRTALVLKAWKKEALPPR